MDTVKELTDFDLEESAGVLGSGSSSSNFIRIASPSFTTYLS